MTGPPRRTALPIVPCLVPVRLILPQDSEIAQMLVRDRSASTARSRLRSAS